MKGGFCGGKAERARVVQILIDFNLKAIGTSNPAFHDKTVCATPKLMTSVEIVHFSRHRKGTVKENGR